MLSSVLCVLVSSKTHALGATEDQITAFNNAVTGGKKEAFIFTVDTTKGGVPIKDKEFKLFNYYKSDVKVYCDINDLNIISSMQYDGYYYCEYSKPGTYTIAVTTQNESFSHLGVGARDIGESYNAKKLISVDQWSIKKMGRYVQYV